MDENEKYKKRTTKREPGEASAYQERLRHVDMRGS